MWINNASVSPVFTEDGLEEQPSVGFGVDEPAKVLVYAATAGRAVGMLQFDLDTENYACPFEWAGYAQPCARNVVEEFSSVGESGKSESRWTSNEVGGGGMSAEILKSEVHFDLGKTRLHSMYDVRLLT